jgi:Flp pilus assembly protein TadG
MKPRRRLAGVSMTEFLIAMPMFMLFVFIVAELMLMYQAKAVVDLAAQAAARTGAVHKALRAPMVSAAAIALAPLYPASVGTGAASGNADLDELKNSIEKSNADAATSNRIVRGATNFSEQDSGGKLLNGAGGADIMGAVQLRIVSPTRTIVQGLTTRRTQTVGGIPQEVVPNDNLTYRQGPTPGGSYAYDIRDANLLKIQLTYWYRMKMPFTHFFFSPFFNANPSDWYSENTPGARAPNDPIRDVAIPLVAYATARMQSDVLLTDLEP